MPAFLDRGDRRLVIGAIVVMLALVGLTYLLRPVPVQQAIGTPSSYSTGWLGTKAAFLLLEQSGYPVERWEAPPTELPPQSAGTTLIFAEPSSQGTAEERAAVSQFVSAGGRLLVMGASGASFAPQSKATPIPSADLTPLSYLAQIPSPLSRNAPEVTMVAPDEWFKYDIRGLTDNFSSSQLAVYAKDGKPGVVWYRFGKGEVIWWAIASPASNGSIREKGNLALFMNSVGPPGTHVIWDEYFHGMRRSLVSYFAKTPLPWAGLQVVLACVVLIFTFSRRSGPVWVPLADSRSSALEFVNTLGDLYQSAHAAPAAVEVAYHRLRLSLSRKLGISTKSRLPELSRAAASHFGFPEDALFQTLSQAERSMRDINLDNEEALDLVRTLHDYTDRLDTQRKPAQENSGWK